MEKDVNNTEQLERIRTDRGFIAALDQSGGSTPKALQLYGISEDQYRDEEEMFKLIHDMRTRIITSPSFSQSQILGAILFEQTIDRPISGIPTADFLWQTKKIIPFLKVDKGLKDAKDGVRLMKDVPDLRKTLKKASEYGIFGTKMRSVIDEDNALGIDKIVKRIRDRVGNNPLYLSIDIDVLDPAFAPGTGTPEVAGMTTREIVNVIRGLSGLNLISADVVEVAPAYDHAEVTSLAAATIVYELINLFAKN